MLLEESDEACMVDVAATKDRRSHPGVCFVVCASSMSLDDLQVSLFHFGRMILPHNWRPSSFGHSYTCFVIAGGSRSTLILGRHLR